MKCSWIAWLGALALAGCTTPLAVEGAACPCPEDFACDPVSKRCTKAPVGPPQVMPDSGVVAPPIDREATTCVQPGPAIVRPLSAREYRNTLQDLLGVTADTSGLPEDSDDLPEHGEPIITSPFMSELTHKFGQAADRAAASAVADLGKVLPCQPDPPGQSACARKLAEDLGLRALRRPLTTREVDSFVAAFDEGRRTYGGDKGAYGRVIQQLLASPDFYLRRDLGQETGPRKGLVWLTQWEIATRLSYFLWGTMPDDELRTRAAAGGLAKKADVEAQAIRLLKSPRAEAIIAEFHRRWLLLEQVRTIEKEDPVPAAFSAELRQALLTSGQETAVLGAWRRSLGQPALFGGPLIGNRAMSDFYDLSAPAGTGFEALEPRGTQKRFGLLTLPALMSTLADRDDSNPVRRGGFVVRRFLCTDIPVPSNLNIPPVQPKSALSNRQRFAAHSENPTCRACHLNLDPIGFALENYDGYGRWREQQNGQPIDVSSGEVGDLLGKPFVGPQGLADLLASHDDLAACLADNWFSFAMGRATIATDDCTLKELVREYDAGGRKLQALLIAIVRSDAFLTRTAP